MSMCSLADSGPQCMFIRSIFKPDLVNEPILFKTVRLASKRY